MVNFDVMTITSPEQQLKNIQSVDRNILSTTLITSREDVFETINFLTKELTNPGADVEVIKTQLEIMRKIINTKINLTALVMGINGNTHSITPVIPTEVQQEIIFNNSTNIKSPAKKEGRVIQMTPTKETKETEKVTFFKNYTRRVIFGTAIELSVEVQSLITNAKTESDIDEIAMHLILDERYEDALNLSIDLFSRTKLKTIEEVEKRFLFEVMPWAFNTTCTPLKDMQNITLSIWADQLLQKKANNPVVEATKIENNDSMQKSTQLLKERYKEEGTISKTVQIDLVNNNSQRWSNPLYWKDMQKEELANAKVRLINLLKEADINPNDFVVDTIEDSVPTRVINWEQVTKNAKGDFINKNGKVVILATEAPTIAVKTVAEIEKETLEELNKGVATGKAAEKFFKEMKDVPEAKAEKGFAGKLWQKTLDTWKTLLQKKAEIENEEENTGDAVKTAAAIINQIPVDKEHEKAEFEKLIKEIIIHGYKDPSLNSKNEFDRVAKEKGAKKFLDGNLTNWFNSWKTEVLKEQPELTEIKRKTVITKPLFKKFKVEEKNPDVWESAKLTKTIEEFDKLIDVITFEKKELGWIVSANLVDQYLHNFESTKDFDEVTKHQWFKDCVNKHAEERKSTTIITSIEEKKDKKEEGTITTAPKQEAPIVEKEATEEIKKSKPYDAKKYESIVTEGNKGKLNALCGDFLLEIEHGNLESRKEELTKMLQQNGKYAKAKPSEISNYIAKLGKINGAIEKLA